MNLTAGQFNPQNVATVTSIKIEETLGETFINFSENPASLFFSTSVVDFNLCHCKQILPSWFYLDYVGCMEPGLVFNIVDCTLRSEGGIP